METAFSKPYSHLAEKAGIGYNNNRFFAGGEISLAQSFKKQKNTTVHTKSSRAFIQVYAGYRINWNPFRKK